MIRPTAVAGREGHESTSAAVPDTGSNSRGGLRYGLVLAALGVVYGDIGTSPLYALRESFLTSRLALTPLNILGVLSLIFWSLILIVSIKYLIFILRADNCGEGGMLALSSLLIPRAPSTRSWWFLLMLALFGTALLYGDGMITPAISVLSAIEGLTIVTPALQHYVQPITIAILVALFACQSRGTEAVGRIFGPIMLLWFLVLAILGVRAIVNAPAVLAAVNPCHAVAFFVHNGWVGYFVLGSVFLVITGGEALYADLGHFGPTPIRAAWFALVLPALVLNYFGQGALLLHDPSGVEHPFFRLAPQWALLPLVVLATFATVIASQALISGAFSLTMQAVQLGYAPRVFIEHTSAHQRGQIYVPLVNWALMVCCIGLVIGFRTSSRLAAAYGVGVTTVMVITTILFFVLIHEKWHWNLFVGMLFAGVYLFIDLAFWGANIIKVHHGGWFPLVVGLLIFTGLTTWRMGRHILSERLVEHSRPLQQFLEEIARTKPVRVPGTAVFMFRNLDAVPPALLQNLRHNKVLHERVVILCVQTAEVGHVAESERLQLNCRAENVYTVQINYGFRDEPDVPAALKLATDKGLPYDPENTTYFLGRENLIATHIPGMAIWRERMFAWMSRNARSAPMFFKIPPDRAVEMGMQIEL